MPGWRDVRSGFVAPRRVGIQLVEVPARAGRRGPRPHPGPGISGGTELLAYRGVLDPGSRSTRRSASLGGTFRYPFPYGYSCVGEVEHSACPVPAGRDWSSPSIRTRTGSPCGADDVVVARRAPTPRRRDALPARRDRAAVSPRCRRRASRSPSSSWASGRSACSRRPCCCAGRRDGGRRRSARGPSRDRGPVRRPRGRRPEIRRSRRALTVGRGRAARRRATGPPTALAHALELLAHEGEALVCSWYGTKDGRAAARRRVPPAPAADPEHARCRRSRRARRALGRAAAPAVAARLLGELPAQAAGDDRVRVRGGGGGLRGAGSRRRGGDPRRTEVLMFEVGAIASVPGLPRHAVSRRPRTSATRTTTGSTSWPNGTPRRARHGRVTSTSSRAVSRMRRIASATGILPRSARHPS